MIRRLWIACQAVAGPLRRRNCSRPIYRPIRCQAEPTTLWDTWQDLIVPRAGCGRTKSVLIDAQAWSLKPPLIPILHLLGSAELPTETDAVRIELEEQLEGQLPPAPTFSASELLEALFLEDVKPVVVFVRRTGS